MSDIVHLYAREKFLEWASLPADDLITTKSPCNENEAPQPAASNEDD